ncbi:MAG: rRNA pseudouridine synthase [Candidatus Omnitrophica bacterium]|nr:rRNA pseudouridine synthase [Candidatus Omnitrophota bacterium]
MRLQVFLSHNGVCSRRKAFALVQSGFVSVNGNIVDEPSFDVDSQKDMVRVGGKLIKPKDYEYVLLNKPKGYVTTKEDKFAEKTVYDLLPSKFGHLSPVGRLDKNTEGLLLLTNDGNFSQRLTHPKFNVKKNYFVRINGILSEEEKKALETGVMIDGKKTSPAEIKNIKTQKDTAEFCITIHEGRNRQIRKMCEAIGKKVIYLKRVSEGVLKLGALPSSKFRSLSREEIQKLLA